MGVKEIDRVKNEAGEKAVTISAPVIVYPGNEGFVEEPTARGRKPEPVKLTTTPPQ